MLSSEHLTRMRSAAVDHMMDTCVIQTCTQTADTFGEMVETFADGSAQVCGLDMRPGSERKGKESTVVMYDATLRLAITSTPSAKDRIKITKRYGETLSTALVFGIVGPIQRGPSGIRLQLKKLEI